MKTFAFATRLLAVVGIVGSFAAIHGGCGSTAVGTGSGGHAATSSGTSGLGGSDSTSSTGTGAPECQTAADCGGTDTGCAHPTCVNNVCGMGFKPDGFPTTSQVAGDCKHAVCDGLGVVKMVPDDTDLPADLNACSTGVCVSGAPIQKPRPAGTKCGPDNAFMCDATGNCSCTKDSDCGTGTACASFTCNAMTNVCSTAFTPKGQGKPGGGVVGDCMKVTCDGQGGPMQSIDDTNSGDDGKPCTNDICTNGVPSHPFAAAGSSCGGNAKCDGSGKCVGCNTVADCPADSGCLKYTCQANTCVSNNMVAGCDGICGSGTVLDQCGVCGGNNAAKGCDGVCNSGKVLDMCGVCGGNNAAKGCDGVCNSGKVVDQCGVCGGNNASKGCDGICGSGKVVDQCGVCGGNNAAKGCDGVCNSGKVIDPCGNCGGTCICAPGTTLDCGHCLDGAKTCNVNGQYGLCIGATPNNQPCP
ncbi:MAG: hypothetical protein ABJE95_13365 [Byssovorax sp.]